MERRGSDDADGLVRTQLVILHRDHCVGGGKAAALRRIELESGVER